MKQSIVISSPIMNVHQNQLQVFERKKFKKSSKTSYNVCSFLHSERERDTRAHTETSTIFVQKYFISAIKMLALMTNTNVLCSPYKTKGIIFQLIRKFLLSFNVDRMMNLLSYGMSELFNSCTLSGSCKSLKALFNFTNASCAEG